MSIMAVVAAVAVLSSWVLDVFFGLKPIGTLPVVYDLSLAYLIGWLVHLLVVVIPERRKVRAIMRTLRGNLMMIANNGPDLIRDLEFIGRCPERPITEDHVLKVCTANSCNDSMKMFISMRLSVARDAYRRVTPFLTYLPHDVAIAIQEVDQQFINVTFEVSDHREKFPRDTNPNGPSLQPNDLRAPEIVWTLTTGAPIPKRYTLQGWKTLVFDYYMSTEHVLAAVNRFFEGVGEHSEGVEFWINHKLNEPGYPFKDYPTDASTDAWTSTPPTVP